MSAGAARITGQGPGNRRILIFANEPFDLQDRSNAGREEEAARRTAEADRLLRASGGEATVVVHRGHSYHVDKTLDHVTRSTGVVFLGSCRGLGKVTSVLEIANAAHVFATRGVGTQVVNDPLLKSFNDELLQGGATLDWAEFWRKLESRLGRQRAFPQLSTATSQPGVDPAAGLLSRVGRDALVVLPQLSNVFLHSP